MASDSSLTSSSPSRMRSRLVTAGEYNIVWGSMMILSPIWTLEILGMSLQTTERWPQVWACIGMIVGVYGVGYLFAARDQLPWSMGITILMNDLLWWIPFSMILWHAVRAALRGHGIGKLDGDGFQMPGAFVIHCGEVVRSYRHTTASDRPNLEEFVCPIN